MPSIYLSPSAQEGNFYVTGPSEEEIMNRLADALEPYLAANGFSTKRNDRGMSVNEIIRDSNAGKFDLHIALHSNAAPEGKYGTERGIIVYYYPGSAKGKRAAEILAKNLAAVYPDPSLVRAAGYTRLGELRYTKNPAVFLEIGYHDNEQDAAWITKNLDAIAKAVAKGLTEYFGLPFVEPNRAQTAVVAPSYGNLNLREYPNTGARILTSVPKGTTLAVSAASNGWYRTTYNGKSGYVSGKFLQLR
jgi:N-acetylmuramoyl-L-alanine amidase